MRTLSKPSTAQCNLAIYTLYLLADPKQVSCLRLARILGDLSHDSINRFLLRERYSPQDLFAEVRGEIELEGGTLSGDDTVLDKPYRDRSKTELVDYFWSGKHKRAVKGVNLVTLYYTDTRGVSVPVNYRVNDKRDGKTKHDYLREMIAEVIEWGIVPAMITADCWYASVGTLTLLKEQEWGFLFGIEANRLVRLTDQPSVAVRSLDIPPQGLVVHLKRVGTVKLFRSVFKDEFRYYVLSLPPAHAPVELNPIERETLLRAQLEAVTEAQFKRLHDLHWGVEQFHRAVKQVCNIERFQVRDTQAIHTHLFSALRAFVHLELKRVKGEIHNWYQVQQTLFNPVIRAFIQSHLPELTGV